MLDFGIADRRALICASSRGLGYGCAEALARAGVTLILNARDEAQLTIAADTLRRKTGAQIEIVAADICTEEGRSLVLKKAGRIDILVNNAAINPFFGPVEDLDPSIFDKIMEVNVKAPWSLSNLVLPHLKINKKGSIINIASVEALTPGAGLGIYSTSKAALLMLSKNQAKEWGKYGVRVNAICPGLIKTKFSAALWQNEKILEKIQKALPSGRMGDPEEMVGLACLLASDAGAYMTGGVYTADGGYMIAG